jgi:plastocyanin
MDRPPAIRAGLQLGVNRVRHLIVRAFVAASVATGLGLLATAPAVAGGGGHCNEPLAEGSGTHVEMIDACFTPAILTVGVDETIRFTNRDDMAHNVAPAGWGWGHVDEMWKDESFTATFDEAGVYPYACSLHPGMTGTLIVEDDPAAAATSTAAAGVGGSVDAIAAGAAGAAGAACGYLIARRRERSRPQPYQPVPGE